MPALRRRKRRCDDGRTNPMVNPGAMGATLADGGVNPLTKERVIDADSCKFALAVMTTAGLYETSEDWLYVGFACRAHPRDASPAGFGPP